MDAAGHETGDMGHVDHEIGTDRIGDLAETLPVPDTRIGGAASQNQLGLVLVREPFDLVHVEQVIVLPHPVGNDVEPLAGHIDRRAVGQVAT